MDTSEIPRNAPSRKRSAKDYSAGCLFQVFHSPNIEFLVKMLQKHPDCIGFKDRINLLSDGGRKLLKSTRLWDPFAKRLLVSGKIFITGEEKELGKMNK